MRLSITPQEAEIARLCRENASVKADRDRLQAELAQAQAKGAEIGRILSAIVKFNELQEQAEAVEKSDEENSILALVETLGWSGLMEEAKTLRSNNPGQPLLDRLEKLERVRPYARHKGNCKSLEPIAIDERTYKPCSCGFDEALAACKEGK